MLSLFSYITKCCLPQKSTTYDEIEPSQLIINHENSQQTCPQPLSDRGNSSIEIASPQITLVCAKLTKTNHGDERWEYSAIEFNWSDSETIIFLWYLTGLSVKNY